MAYITSSGEIRDSKPLVPWLFDVLLSIYQFLLLFVTSVFKPGASRRKAKPRGSYGNSGSGPFRPDDDRPARRPMGGMHQFRSSAPSCPPAGGGS
uniref:Selenoprotein K n=1 Tax=Trichuris muris TaxID=70415 RepID=A0A5S6R079_TRIMR